MAKKKLLSLLVLLMTAATGAWAQSATTTYTVNLNDGTEDNPTTWTALAAKGFVFLPTGGIRLATSVTRPNVEGYYWSSDTDPSNSCNSYFIPVIGPLAPTTKDDSRRCGFSVRLVYDIE